VVPPILQKRAILRNLVDIATIVGQFGLGLAAINVLK
jgi:polysaccharide export outer membrane protein